jgi:outer membrane receptor protein involved in Fe transport
MARKLWLGCIGVCLAVLFCSFTNGQTVTATLVGNITDSSGALIPDAQVVVTEQDTGIIRTTKSDSGGQYTVPYLPSGTYRIDITSSGMTAVARTDVRVHAGSTIRVDAGLVPATVSTAIDVKAETPVLQTDRGDISKTFDTRSTRELPLIDRNYQALGSLLAGVAEPVDEINQEDPQQNTFYFANGQSYTGNNTTVDGVANKDPLMGLTVYIPPPEAVEEVNVSTGSYSAEYGQSGGVVMNVVTRGGTNQIHGGLFEFNRVTALQARNLFNTDDQPKPNTIRNEFGGSIGGPIIKNKTFYFASYQGRYLRQANTQLGTVPIGSWRNGDFSAVPDTTIYDPTTGNADGTGRQPIAGNIIPASRISPVAANLIPYIPVPNQPGESSNLRANPPFTYDGNSWDGRLDHNFNDSSRMFAKFNQSIYSIKNHSIMGDQIGDGIISDDANTSAILSFTHSFSPTLLTEARAGYNRYWVRVDPANSVTSGDIGIQIPQSNDTAANGLANIAVNGMNGIGGSTNYPLRNADNLISFLNNWTKIIPKHTFKAGVQLVRIRADRFQPEGMDFGPRGKFVFTSATTSLNGAPGAADEFAASFAAMLLGAPDMTSRTYMTMTPTNRQWQVGAFVQDSWQVSSKLSLELGLRYDLWTAMQPRYAGGASNYQPADNSLIIAGVGSVGMSTNVDTQSKNFQPRFGATYRLSSKSVIRGGYGLSYWMPCCGFNGGALSTQFPVIYNIQNGVPGDYVQSGNFDSIPSVTLIPIPSNGILLPAPDQGYETIPKDYKVPKVHSFNVTYQREILPGTTVDIAYVGTQGRNLPYLQELNYAFPGGGDAGRQLVQQFGRESSTTFLNGGLSNSYNSLQISAEKRFSHGLSFTTAYTWSRALDYGSAQAWFFINTSIARNYGPADFDRTHQLTISHIYELPFGKGKSYLQSGVPAVLLGGWQVNGIFRGQTGTPFSILADMTPCNCPGNNGNFADAVAPVKYLGGLGPDKPWFDPSSFAAPAPNTFGNTGRNLVRGPGWWNYDMSVFRTFPIKERMKIEFRAEFNNLTNTPKWGNPNNWQSSPDTLGRIYYAWGQRQIQFAGRILF